MQDRTMLQHKIEKGKAWKNLTIAEEENNLHVSMLC